MALSKSTLFDPVLIPGLIDNIKGQELPGGAVRAGAGPVQWAEGVRLHDGI